MPVTSIGIHIIYVQFSIDEIKFCNWRQRVISFSSSLPVPPSSRIHQIPQQEWDVTGETKKNWGYFKVFVRSILEMWNTFDAIFHQINRYYVHECNTKQHKAFHSNVELYTILWYTKRCYMLEVSVGNGLDWIDLWICLFLLRFVKIHTQRMIMMKGNQKWIHTNDGEWRKIGFKWWNWHSN